MNLRNPNVESVATYLAAQGEPDNAAPTTSRRLEPSLATADEVAAKLRALPQVARVTTLSTFIPTQQDQKLPLIQNAAETLEPALSPDKISPPPTDAENIAIINSTVDGAQQICRRRARSRRRRGEALGRGHGHARQGRSGGAPARRNLAFVQPLKTALDNLRQPAQGTAGYPRKSAAGTGEPMDHQGRAGASRSHAQRQ